MIDTYISSNWKQVVDSMTEGLMLVSPRGTILYVNKSLQELLHYDLDELVGKNCSVLECSTCFQNRNKGEDKYCSLFKKGTVKNLRCAFRRKDGQFLEGHKNATILYDTEGNVVAGVENFTDISPILVKDQEISVLKKQLSIEENFYGIIGSSHIMQDMYQLIESAAMSDAPVLISGESGTGKELVANALYELSDRKNKAFIKVNCAALNENLLESELFGHVKGAFSGAEHTRKGRFEAADGGCIFLDEIGDISQRTQTKLLRILQEKEFEKVGDNRTVSVDVRIIAATNKNLIKAMEEGYFREDLFYRLNVIPVHIAPLRDRKSDVSEIVKTFIKRLRIKTEKDITGINKTGMDLLLGYHWPGNVRELINVLEYAFVLCKSGEITEVHLPAHFSKKQVWRQKTPRRTTKQHRRKFSYDEIANALDASQGNKTKAAEILGVSRVTLWKYLKNQGA